MLEAAWGGAAVLTLYGVSQTTLAALVWLGQLEVEQDFSASELRWRMLLWEPWLLVWGVLLGVAAGSTGAARAGSATSRQRR